MTIEQINKAMDEVAKLNEDGIDVQGGKKYTQVVTRMEVFRRHFGFEYGVDTQISAFGGGVLCKAYITKGAEVMGAGHAYMTALNKKKNLEKLESTAIGRALASIGLSGGEYASANEMESWEERYTSGISHEDITGQPKEPRKITTSDLDVENLFMEMDACDTEEKIPGIKAKATELYKGANTAHRTKITQAVKDLEARLAGTELDSQYQQRVGA